LFLCISLIVITGLTKDTKDVTASKDTTASFTINAATSFVQNGHTITITNNRNSNLIGAHFIGSKDATASLTFIDTILPGKSMKVTIADDKDAAASYILDGAAFDDDYIEGPNKWGIDRYLRARKYYLQCYILHMICP
jgi:hypothetical protein